jgi:ABC-type Fe3+-hydroxamate transport system substrate-binding protein
MSDFSTTATDARDRTITVASPPQRIVSLVPSITELLADLDLEREVVGLTRFCERPEGWREAKTIIGGTKSVKTEVVADLAPDLVIANREENEKTDVEALDDLAPVYVTDVASVDDALAMIRTVGTLTGRTDRARAMAERIAQHFADLPEVEPIRAAYLIWREPYMTVGGDTFIHDVMARGGFQNVYGDATRYPTVTLDDLATRDLDVVLCSSEPFPFHQKERFTADLRDALPHTPVKIVDGQAFSWYGSRLLHTPNLLRDVYASVANADVP